MSATWVIYIAAGVASAIVSRFADRHPSWGQWWYATWMAVSVTLSALEAAQHDWALSAWLAVCAVLNGLNWWKSRKRRKRKRAAALAGAKSRARIEALVRKVRETARPRRTLRPVPGRTLLCVHRNENGREDVVTMTIIVVLALGILLGAGGVSALANRLRAVADGEPDDPYTGDGGATGTGTVHEEPRDQWLS